MIVVQDLEAMVGFYSDCLGLAVSDRGHTRGRSSDAPTPWDVRQPAFFQAMDLGLDDEALVAWGRGLLEGHEHWERGQRPRS